MMKRATKLGSTKLRPMKVYGALVVALIAQQLLGWLLAFSGLTGGAFSPGEHAWIGISLALLLVLIRLVFWLLILPLTATVLVAQVWRWCSATLSSRNTRNTSTPA